MCGSLRLCSCKQWNLCIAVLTQGRTLILIDWFLQLVRYFYCINLFLTRSRRHQQPKSAKLFWEFVLLSLNSQQAIFQPAWNKHNHLIFLQLGQAHYRFAILLQLGQPHFCQMPPCLHDLQWTWYAHGGWLKAQLGGSFVFPELKHFASAQCSAPMQHSTSVSCGFGKSTEENSSGERNVFSQPAWWIFLPQTFFFWLAVSGSSLKQQWQLLPLQPRAHSLFLTCLPSFCKPGKGNFRRLEVSSHFSWGKKVLLVPKLLVWLDRFAFFLPEPKHEIWESSLQCCLQTFLHIHLLIIWHITHITEERPSLHAWTICC